MFLTTKKLLLLTLTVSWMGEGVQALEGIGKEGNGVDAIVQGKLVSNVLGS